ncbi:hypothetical protein ACQPZF_19745 [Actinosynnema sp. CS-041913]|uniref:hypothetical protein n=1 Tax=Actinosynnema sp. CS-041913 TaxID=3239917 RepID=UPI003D922256
MTRNPGSAAGMSNSGVSNFVTDPSGATVQARDVYGGINYGRRKRPRLVLLCAVLSVVLLLIVGYLVFLRPTPVRVVSPAHGATVDRCVQVTVEGRAAMGRGLVVGVYAAALDVVYLSRVLDGDTTDIPLTVGGQDDPPRTTYDVVVLSAPTAFLDALRQAAKPGSFTAADLAERDVTRETKITVVRKGPGPDHC